MLLVPVVELAGILEVGRVIGPGLTLLALLAGVVLGVAVVRRAGASAWSRVRQRTAEGLTPSREAADAALVLLAGVLLALPGFVSDVVALVVLFPPTRSLLRRPLERFVGRVAVVTGPATSRYRGPVVPGQVVEGTVVEGEVLDDDR